MAVASYIAYNFFYRIWDFLVHWYYHGFRIIVGFALRILESLDHVIAFRVTLAHFFEPLYQDYSALGYVFGFFFRSFRVLAGSVVYALLIALFICVYVVWAATPLYLFSRIIRP